MSKACFHCGLAVPPDTDFRASINGQAADFCCPGCQAVALAIVDGGLGSYYQFRTETNQKPAANPLQFQVYDNPGVQDEFVEPCGDGLAEAHLLVEGISCAACVWLLEKHLSRLPGVQQVQVSAASHRARIVWASAQLDLSRLFQAIADIGYSPLPATQNQQQALRQRENRLAQMRLAIAGFGMMQVGMAAVALYAGAGEEWRTLLRWVSLLIATPVVLFAAQPFFRAAVRSLTSRHLTMDVPVSLAIGGAYIASAWATFSGSGEVYFDSVSMFTFFLLLGRYLEMQIRHRNGLAQDTLSQLVPLAATRVEKDPALDERGPAAQAAVRDGDRAQRSSVAVRELQAGDWLEVASGDNIPCDGVVVAGRSQVDESLLTGEAEPVAKQPGAQVVAGSVNLGHRLLLEVTAIGRGTRLNAIERLVESSRQYKPVQVAVADRVAAYFVAAVLLVSVVVMAAWWHIEPDKAIWVTLSVLVVTCPCALSLATPVALTAALNYLRQSGLLITRGHVLESLPRINHVIFDKTGTLTLGQPQLQRLQLTDLGRSHFAASETRALAVIAALEAGSNHPVGWAFRRWQGELFAQQVEQQVGAGVSGQVGGVGYRFGKADFTDVHEALVADKLQPGEQRIYLTAADGGLLASAYLRDELRPEAAAVVKALQARGLMLSLVSGDHPQTVEQLAAQLGIELVLASATPEAKIDYLKEAQAAGDRVLVVGDGINDVPVLSAADVSVAMGSATDLAKAQADSILLNGDLFLLPNTLDYSRRVRQLIKQNLTWALVYNASALPLAALGWIPPYLAAIGMSASSLVVIFNAMRLNRAPEAEKTAVATPVLERG